ncbi:MAG: PKD domain-containing protein [Saprospiraceae bacterium]|nr:PKD domain-containing protein [Saprospiraceae bacterium]
MKSVIMVLLFVVGSQAISFSQQVLQREKRDHIWLFGFGNSSLPPPGFGNTTVSFNYSPPLAIEDDHPMNFEAANASMCNAEGELLFYSNGVYIANHLHQPMENGMGLSPTPFTAQWANNGIIYPQAVLALPQTGNRYLLLHSPIDRRSTPNEHGELLFCAEQLYSTIDMSGNEGLGVVVEKNMVIIPDTIDRHGKLTAVRHANGRDWWVIIPAYYSNRYYRLLITPDTILNLGLQAVGDTIPSGLGQAVFSPDGTKYARLNLYQLGGDQYIDLYDFDRCSGLLSNPRHFTYRDTAILGGVAFSENSRFLYVSSFKYLYQLDTENDDIFSTFELLGRPETESYFLPQLAPDGKIYISTGGTSIYVHVIRNPNKRSTNSNLVQQGMELAAYNFGTMPNHPYYGLGPWDGSPCDTLGIDNPAPRAAFEYTADSSTTAVEFFDGSFFATAWDWDMGDGHSYTARHPVHAYAQAGLYTVCLTASNLTGSHTVCDTVRVGMVTSAGEAQQARSELRIFPNPAHPDVPATLLAEGLPAAEVAGTVRDAFGRIARRFSAPVVNGRLRQELDMRGLPAGVYFVELVSEKGVALGSGKLVIGMR